MPECRTEHRGRVARERRARTHSQWAVHGGHVEHGEITGRFPVVERGWYGHAPRIEQLLREVQVLGSRGTITRLLEDVDGLLEVLGTIIERIRDKRGRVPIRVRTTDDRPTLIVVDFPVEAPAEAISLLDEFDRWLIKQPHQAHRRVIVDVYYRT